MASRRRFARLVSAMLVLAATGRRARSHDVNSAEERVFRWFNGLPDALHVPLWAVMQSGSLAAVFVTAGALARQRKTARAITVLSVGVGVWGGVKMIKPFVGRGRPTAELGAVVVRGDPQNGLGYPSGHSAVAATLAIAMSHDRGAAVRAGAVVVAVLTGGARMYVGAHLPLDVVGGLAIGVLAGGLASCPIDRVATRLRPRR